MKKTRRPTVLIVDDDAEWRGFLSSALSPTYLVISVDNGNEGLAQARRQGPSLIILDAMMPGGMDGFSVLCELQRSARTRDIPVIVCSEMKAVTGMEISAEALREHLNVTPALILEKPVTRETLLAEVERVIQNAGRSSSQL